MEDAVLRKARESARVIEDFFAREAASFAACARSFAERLRTGGRVFTFGNGGSACDALHVAVEFSHPIIEKRRAFQAQALVADTIALTAIGNDADFSRVFADQLRLAARQGDVAIGLSTSGKSANVTRAFQTAKELGLLTIALTGKDGGRLPSLADHCFVVPSFSIHRIQEVHTVALHLLWDLVHVALGEEDVL